MYVFTCVCRCVEEGGLVEVDQFVVAGKTMAQQFGTGKIVGMLHTVYMYVYMCIYIYIYTVP